MLITHVGDIMIVTLTTSYIEVADACWRQLVLVTSLIMLVTDFHIHQTLETVNIINYVTILSVRGVKSSLTVEIVAIFKSQCHSSYK